MEIFFCALTFMFVKTRWNLYPHSKLSSFSMWSFVQKLNGTCEKENKKTKHNGIVTTYEKLYTIMIIFSPPSNVSSNYYNEICNICYRLFIEKRTKWKNQKKSNTIRSFFSFSSLLGGIGSMHHSQYLTLHSHIIFIWTYFSSLEAFAVQRYDILCAHLLKSTWKPMQKGCCRRCCF